MNNALETVPEGRSVYEIRVLMAVSVFRCMTPRNVTALEQAFQESFIYNVGLEE
jgi:hypothetical protein